MSEQRLQVPAALDQDTGRDLARELRANGALREAAVVVDFADTERMDSRGAAWLIDMAAAVRRGGGELRVENASGQVADFIDLIGPALETPRVEAPRRPGVVEQLGGAGIRFIGEVREAGELVVEALYWTLMAPFEGRGFRVGLFMDQLHEMGVRAVRIVLMMNLLLGLTIAMLSAAQLSALGLDIWVADLVMIGFARELAAIMTAIVVAARTGAAIAAEIATMKVQEEVDALRGMGLNVAQMLVAPRLLALFIVLPCLTALGMVAGVAGGTIWGTLVLDHNLAVWLRETHMAADLSDIFQGLFKSLHFAIAIVLVGCHTGLRVSGGSRGVGLMTTRAVVIDIFLIVTIDMIFAAIFYYALD